MKRPNVDPTGFIAVRVWSNVSVTNNEERTGQVTTPFYANLTAAIAGGLEIGDEYLDQNACVRRVHLPCFTSNANAIAGGLSAGDLYLDTGADTTGQTIREVT